MIAAAFPGVGAQRTGMGAVLRDRSSLYRNTIDEACDVLGPEFADIIFAPEYKARLKRQEESQLAVLVTGVAMFRVYQDEIGIPVSYLAGHSLGEYTALTCAGALELAEAIELVRRRGELIRAASDRLDGTMMWVVGLDVRTVDAVCQARRDEGRHVHVSAYDAPRQSAVSGGTADVGEVVRDLEARGALVYPLRMEGPYHSPLMRPAAEGLRELLADVELRAPRVPVLSTVDGRPHEGGRHSAALLAEQLVAPVRWLDVQRTLLDEGVRMTVECGPGNVLSYLTEQTTRLIRPLPYDRLGGPGELAAAMHVAAADYPGIVDRCLRVVVSTRSRTGTEGSARYAAGVVGPYRELERIRALPDLGRADVDRALAGVEAILTAKGLPERERRRRLNTVLAGRLWTS